MRFKIKMKKAYTLAEVLITLGIIGIIAALLLPGLINKTRLVVDETKVKKNTSDMTKGIKTMIAQNEGCATMDCTVLNDALFHRAYLDEGDMMSWFMPSDNNLTRTMKKIYKADQIPTLVYTMMMEEPHYSSDEDVENYANELANITLLGIYKLPNGSAIYLGEFPYAHGGNGETMPIITLDINAEKGPNALGQDWFVYGFSEAGDLVSMDNEQYLKYLNKQNVPVGNEQDFAKEMNRQFPKWTESGRVFINSLTKK